MPASELNAAGLGAHAPAPILDDPNPGVMRWFLHALYDLVWLAVIVVAAPWWIWRCLSDTRFRAMAKERLAIGVPTPQRAGGRRRVLIHGVSVGEVKGAQALVHALRNARPDLDVVISTTTDTGLNVARKLYPELEVVRFPLDLSFVVRRFLARLSPVCVVLVELEIWPNFLRQANRAGIPLAVVNGRITEKSFAHYRWFKNLLPQFNRISLFCVQDEEYATRFCELEAARERVIVTGNIKVDGLKVGAVEPRPEIARLLGGKPGQKVIVAGSTHQPEESWIAQAWCERASAARLILVPRHPERAGTIVRELEAAAWLGPARAPQLLTQLRAGLERPDPSRPVLVDTIGELEQVYALADLVFVGGSLIPHGGQNMLEPAAQKKSTFYGPHVDNFPQEAALLERAGAALRIASRAVLGETLASLIADPERRARMGAAGLDAVEAQKGATALTLRALEERCLAFASR
jgi:3-deoxy-D-manno-octulosonic-acid transferase